MGPIGLKGLPGNDVSFNSECTAMALLAWCGPIRETLGATEGLVVMVSLVFLVHLDPLDSRVKEERRDLP